MSSAREKSPATSAPPVPGGAAGKGDADGAPPSSAEPAAGTFQPAAPDDQNGRAAGKHVDGSPDGERPGAARSPGMDASTTLDRNGSITSAGSPRREARNGSGAPADPGVDAPTAVDPERLARVALMRAADCGDPFMGRLVESCGPVEALQRIRSGDSARRVLRGVTRPDADDPEEGACHGSGTYGAFDGRARHDRGGRTHRDHDHHDRALPDPALRDRVRYERVFEQRLSAWRARLLAADPEGDLAAGEAYGARLVLPGDVEWPTQLDDLGETRPLGLWVHGSADLRFSCLRSVAVVGARAATAYGAHVATTIGAELSGSGWTIVSGGAYGVDGAAHRGALAGDSPTIAVLACGIDFCYPKGHHDLFAVVRENGALVSECPPGTHPTRGRFLIRNRLIAALSRGTLVVEAAVRSGAMNTANHALALRRHLGAVPGPVTSETSQGCHLLLRQGKAVCVTGADEMIELVGEIGGDLAPERRGPVVPRDALSPAARAVLDAVPTRGGAETATIAIAAGVDITTALSCLGSLAAAGYVQRCPRGWRTRPQP